MRTWSVSCFRRKKNHYWNSMFINYYLLAKFLIWCLLSHVRTKCIFSFASLCGDTHLQSNGSVEWPEILEGESLSLSNIYCTYEMMSNTISYTNSGDEELRAIEGYSTEKYELDWIFFPPHMLAQHLFDSYPLKYSRSIINTAAHILHFRCIPYTHILYCVSVIECMTIISVLPWSNV